MKIVIFSPIMATRLFAIGDIHGCFEPFRRLLENVIRIVPEDKIILIGDYIDRGKNSREVIDYILDLKEKGYDINPLMGNHELMLLDAIESGDPALWLWNGGAETLKSFGIGSINDLENKYIWFFKELTWYIPINEYLFVHAGFNDSMADPFKDKMSMVWTRRESYNNPLLTEKTIIHGHTPVSVDILKETISNNNNVIDIDTGCVYTGKGLGKLTAFEVNTRALFFS